LVDIQVPAAVEVTVDQSVSAITIEPQQAPQIIVEPGGASYTSQASESRAFSGEHGVAQPISALRVVYLNGDGLFDYASSDEPSHAYRIAGVSLNTIQIGSTAAVLRQGLISESSWNWALGTPVFLGLNGNLTQIPPESGFLLRVGYPETANSLYVEFSPPIYLD
jgi:hypothetical protein